MLENDILCDSAKPGPRLATFGVAVGARTCHRFECASSFVGIEKRVLNDVDDILTRDAPVRRQSLHHAVNPIDVAAIELGKGSSGTFRISSRHGHVAKEI